MHQLRGARHGSDRRKCHEEFQTPQTLRHQFPADRYDHQCDFLLFIRVESPVWRVVSRLLLIPVIAGVSYEFIRIAGNSDSGLVNLLSKPGMAMQRLTTKEPTPDMAEVAIAAVEAVFDWRAYLNENFGRAYTDEERALVKETMKKARENSAKADA